MTNSIETLKLNSELLSCYKTFTNLKESLDNIDQRHQDEITSLQAKQTQEANEIQKAINSCINKMKLINTYNDIVESERIEIESYLVE